MPLSQPQNLSEPQFPHQGDGLRNPISQDQEAEACWLCPGSALNSLTGRGRRGTSGTPLSPRRPPRSDSARLGSIRPQSDPLGQARLCLFGAVRDRLNSALFGCKLPDWAPLRQARSCSEVLGSARCGTPGDCSPARWRLFALSVLDFRGAALDMGTELLASLRAGWSLRLGSRLAGCPERGRSRGDVVPPGSLSVGDSVEPAGGSPRRKLLRRGAAGESDPATLRGVLELGGGSG